MSTEVQLISCTWCGGTGRIMHAKNGIERNCKACEGTGYLPSPMVYRYLGLVVNEPGPKELGQRESRARKREDAQTPEGMGS